jgi:hypothetical protein
MTPSKHHVTVRMCPEGGASPLADETLSLPLQRWAGSGKPVLLLHGANTSGAIFSHPGKGLVGYLREEQPDLDIWVLEWRGSPEVLSASTLEQPRSREWVTAERAVFTIANVAEQDIVAALFHIEAERAREKLVAQAVSVVGFCVGAGALSHAIASGHVTRAQVDRIVLLTLGLFYKAPWDGWLKCQEFLLEQTIAQRATERVVSPFSTPWPSTLENAYRDWYGSKAFGDYDPHWYKRLAFMYGEPFSQAALGQLSASRCEQLFGPLHLGLYVDAVRKVRSARPPLIADDDRAALHNFADMDILLLGGAQNRLWHRESLDLMYEWLLRGSRNKKRDCTKRVLHDFAHLDLLWGENAPKQVYPVVLDAVC